mgnify:CR=1 FL=1
MKQPSDRQGSLLERLKLNRDYCIYVDPAYPIRRQLAASFQGEVGPDMMAFNKEMSRVKQSVEWSGWREVGRNYTRRGRGGGRYCKE